MASRPLRTCSLVMDDGSRVFTVVVAAGRGAPPSPVSSSVSGIRTPRRSRYSTIGHRVPRRASFRRRTKTACACGSSSLRRVSKKARRSAESPQGYPETPFGKGLPLPRRFLLRLLLSLLPAIQAPLVGSVPLTDLAAGHGGWPPDRGLARGPPSPLIRVGPSRRKISRPTPVTSAKI